MMSIFLWMSLLLVSVYFASCVKSTRIKIEITHEESRHSVATQSQWPHFADAVSQYLFTKSEDGFCRGDSLIVTHGFQLYSQWWSSRRGASVCDGNAAKERAEELQEFYTRSLKEELTGATKNEVLQGFEERYMKHSQVWSLKQEATPEKLQMVDGKRPKAIFVLGASASGKTNSFRFRLESLLQRNNWETTVNFITIDGGDMRAQSVVWNEVRKLVSVMPAEAQIAGFGDAYTAIGKPGISKAKSQMHSSLTDQRFNIIIPDTSSATNCVFEISALSRSNASSGCLCPLMKLYNTLVKKNYDVVLTAINTDKNNCKAQGSERALRENKKYVSSEWEPSTLNLVSFFNAARQAGNGNVFMIADNNNHRRISELEHCVPQSGAACRRGSAKWYRSADAASPRLDISHLVPSGKITYPCAEKNFCEEVKDLNPCLRKDEVKCDDVISDGHVEGKEAASASGGNSLNTVA
eukprot:TRINITY_DN22537_c0_g1_i1.p1 TRINITY_DN22537_c0_g1~~TRINITY_DN22537_c0_g1_i1.p1  ORF type:complete len:479 (-),score=63.00 TRINITY_DN22537_c0_g1_i1:214-1614(-)